MSVTCTGSQKQKIEFFSHRYFIEFYETNRMSHVPHLYDVVNLLNNTSNIPFFLFFQRNCCTRESDGAIFWPKMPKPHCV